MEIKYYELGNSCLSYNFLDWNPNRKILQSTLENNDNIYVAVYDFESKRLSKKEQFFKDIKDRLLDSGTTLSGGQQQRLCIARTIAVEPDTILMDEPCSALDPVATKRIEDLMQSLVKDFSILIVTHNMQQASRASDFCAFFTTKTSEDGKSRTGELVEFSDTNTMFTNPTKSLTEEYISGRFG